MNNPVTLADIMWTVFVLSIFAAALLALEVDRYRGRK